MVGFLAGIRGIYSLNSLMVYPVLIAKYRIDLMAVFGCRSQNDRALIVIIIHGKLLLMVLGRTALLVKMLTTYILHFLSEQLVVTTVLLPDVFLMLSLHRSLITLK